MFAKKGAARGYLAKLTLHVAITPHDPVPIPVPKTLHIKGLRIDTAQNLNQPLRCNTSPIALRPNSHAPGDLRPRLGRNNIIRDAAAQRAYVDGGIPELGTAAQIGVQNGH